jgi:hypothetical protein
MSQDHSGYIIHIKRPTREGYVACLVITPKRRDGVTDVAAKVERNLGRAKAIQIAADLLSYCEAPDDLVARVHDLSPEDGSADTE